MTLVCFLFRCGFYNFNSHARVGRDGRGDAYFLQPSNFNSHARVGRDLNEYGQIQIYNDFNSHARVGRDLD